MHSSINSKLKLNNGLEIPQLGLGVWQVPNDQTAIDAVQSALQNGYRLIDTAKIYGNEAAVGKAIKESGIPREEIFLTTKLWNDDQGYDNAIRAFDKSLQTLGLDYVDLYLLHWPVKGKRIESWKALTEIYKSGRAKSIGVSNFMVKHLNELFESSHVLPAVNQIELSPYNFQFRKAVINLCKEKDIKIEAYSPLTRGEKLNDGKLVEIAQKYNKSTAQTLIKWCIQHGFITIPKSENPLRIKDNSNIYDFIISQEDMNRMDEFNEDLVTGWDPTDFE